MVRVAPARTGRPTRVAAVTGGAGGIGAAVVQRLARDGHHVHVLDVVPGHPDAVSHEVDVSDESRVREALREVGPVDVLVNVAGIYGGGAPCWEAPDGAFERVLAVNLAGPYYTCRAVLPGMVERGWGRIVNVSSISARDSMPGSAAYAASKAGLAALTRSIAREVAESGVLVNCVAPGAVDTPMLRASGNAEAAAARTPMRRIGGADEVAAMISWLCSDECSYSTGALFDITGGRSAW